MSTINQDQPSFEFDTREEAKAFVDWFLVRSGGLMGREGRVVIVPAGIGFSQRSLNEAASDFLEEAEEASDDTL